MLIIITKQLSGNLPEDHKLQKHLSVDPKNFKEMLNLFKSSKSMELCVYDATISKKLKLQHVALVKDHINKTGTNVLIGQQNTLKIDFIDQNNLYTHKQDSVIATCCGEKLDINAEYPCYYLCHITTLAKAMRFKTIKGYLYNVGEKPVVQYATSM